MEGAVDGPICRDHERKALHELIPVRKRYLDLLTPDAVPIHAKKAVTTKTLKVTCETHANATGRTTNTSLRWRWLTLRRWNKLMPNDRIPCCGSHRAGNLPYLETNLARRGWAQLVASDPATEDLRSPSENGNPRCNAHPNESGLPGRFLRRGPSLS